MDINEIHREDKEYFWKIKRNCFNDDVGYYLYCYFCEIDVDNLICQNFPETKNKKQTISDSLSLCIHHLRQKYLFKNKHMCVKKTRLFNEYCDYYYDMNNNQDYFPTYKQRLNYYKKLVIYGIKPNKTVKGFPFYKYTDDEWKNIAKRNKRDVKCDHDDVYEPEKDIDDLNFGLDKNDEDKK